IDGNLFVVEGKPLPNVTLETAEDAIWNELNQLKTGWVTEYELDKVKNRMESTMVFAEMAILEKAMNLSYFELLGDANGLNREINHYLEVSADDIQQQAVRLFRKENSSTLIYIADKYAR